MEGAGMKGCSVLEIKVTNSKAFVFKAGMSGILSVFLLLRGLSGIS